MKLLDFSGLSEKGIRFSDTHIWRLIRAGEFPQPVKIGRRSHWSEAEIDDYISFKLDSRNSQNVATGVAKTLPKRK